MNFTRRLSMICLAASCLVVAAPAVLAHEGHGEEELSGTVLHQLLEPVHAWPFWLIATVVLGVVLARRRRVPRPGSDD